MPIVTKYLSDHQLNDQYTLLINSLSGALDIVDNDTVQKIDMLKKGSPESEVGDDILIKALYERGYLFEKAEDEANLMKKHKDTYDILIKETDHKITFVICPTMACNLRCVYCFESEEVRITKEVISDEQLENIFKHIKTVTEEKKPKERTINLFGGEPLLPITYPIIEKILDYAEKEKIPMTITSNGTFLKHFEGLFEKYKNLNIGFQITLDGTKDIHDKRRIKIDKSGTFDDILEGIGLLLNLGIATNVRINVDRENIEELNSLVSMFKEKGWTEMKNFHCDIAPVLDHEGAGKIPNVMPENEIVTRMLELFPNLFDEDQNLFKLSLFKVLHHINKTMNILMKGDTIWKFHYCEANVGKFYIFTPDGFMYACPESVGSEECIIGKYDSEMHFYPEAVERWIGRNIYRIPKCKECKIALFCGGGCAMAALKTNGDMDDPVCNNAEQVLGAYVQSIKELILKKYC